MVGSWQALAKSFIKNQTKNTQVSSQFSRRSQKIKNPKLISVMLQAQLIC
jgi:hypothetical protein